MRSMILGMSLLLLIGGSRADETALAQPLAIEEATELNGFAPYGGITALSPDSSQVAYTACDMKRASEQRAGIVGRGAMATADAPPYTAGCDVWISALDGGIARNITGGLGNSWGAVWSPDGKRLAFLSDRDGKPQLFVWEAKSSAIRKVTEAAVRGTSGALQWLPDNEGILVRLRPLHLSDAELGIKAGTEPAPTLPALENQQLNVTVAYSAAARRMHEDAGVASGADSTGANQSLVRAEQPPKYSIADLAIVSASTGEARGLLEAAPVSAATLSPDGKNVYYLQWQPGREFGAFIARHNLVVLTLASGKRRVVAAGLNLRDAGALSWSPDSRSIAYFSTVASEQREQLQGGLIGGARGDLFVVDIARGKQRRCIPERAIPGFEYGTSAPAWRADSSSVHGIADNAVWRFDLATGQCREWARDPKLTIRSVITRAGGAVWAPESAAGVVLAREEHDQADGFYAIDASGRLRKRVGELARYQEPVVTADGQRLVFKSEQADEPLDMWVTNASFAAPTRITRLNPQLAKYRFGQARVMDFRSADGEPLRASVLLPSDYQPGKRYPTVLVVYASGRGSSDVNAFGLAALGGQYNFQLLATRGYVVIQPDMPVKVGSPLLDSFKTAMAAIDTAVTLGFADPERLAVMGQSNGGYTTLALLVQTQRFKAAVMNAGFGDLGAMFGMRGGVWHQWLLEQGGAMGVAPWEDPLRYVQNSPFYYLHRVTTPLIIQAGGEDVSIEPLSAQVFTALKFLNKDVTYLRYENEDHVLMRSASRVDYWNRILPFFERLVKGSAREAVGLP